MLTVAIVSNEETERIVRLTLPIQDEIDDLRGDAEKKPLDEASLREGPVTDAKYVDEICSLLRQIEPANDVEWPAKEERFILSKKQIPPNNTFEKY